MARHRRRAAPTRKVKGQLPGSAKASFTQEQKYGGLLVTKELETAREECKSRVTKIAQDCRQKNRKFRDIEFDLENDRQRCLYGLSTDLIYNPSDVQRATQIFENPSFFVDGANSNDIIQGALWNDWFLSALATMSTAKGLIEKFCVARDEQVGIYGFIFFRDTAWVVVIVDDLLFTLIPKFEELSHNERQLYHHDKDLFNKSARKSGKSLYFAKSGTDGETWVPLIEKAYAKLHGSYAALAGGESGEAVEDLTGGVNTFIMTKDILDIDRFWKEELSRANVDRLFGCTLDQTRSGEVSVTFNGLIGGHAYSVLRAVEYNGKRFVVIRNPWGRSEWTGPWSDGSKEWTPEWLPGLQKLGHMFGDDGQFVMEYGDFLENWEQIDRIQLFDSTWVMSYQWLEVTARAPNTAWSFGDVSFTISLPAPSAAVIVLSQADQRYFEPISGPARWMFDFVVFRKGETTPVTSSTPARFWSRGVNAEVDLEAGEYVVHVRLDRHIDKEKPPKRSVIESNPVRTLARVLAETAYSRSMASNFDRSELAGNIPIPLSTLAGQDLSELEEKAKATRWLTLYFSELAANIPIPLSILEGQDLSELEEKAKAAADAMKKEVEGDTSVVDADTKSEPEGEEKITEDQAAEEKHEDNYTGETEEKPKEEDSKEKGDGGGHTGEPEEKSEWEDCKKTALPGDAEPIKDELDGLDKGHSNDGDDEGTDPLEEGNTKDFKPSTGGDGGDKGKDGDGDDVHARLICLGLRVYTKADAPAVVGGQLRHEMGLSFDGLAIQA